MGVLIIILMEAMLDSLEQAMEKMAQDLAEEKERWEIQRA